MGTLAKLYFGAMAVLTVWALLFLAGLAPFPEALLPETTTIILEGPEGPYKKVIRIKGD